MIDTVSFSELLQSDYYLLNMKEILKMVLVSLIFPDII